MSSAVAELDAGLQAMLALKPPGATGSRIQSITALCMSNVQSESVLIQKLYTHFKRAPSTHKLGVLYVVDSVTRKWIEQAKAAGIPIGSSAPDGTPAAGVNRVKELLPVLMNDIIASASDDHKEKIKKLVDIWEKGQTFPLQMLNTFKEKLDVTAQKKTTTPDGSPPPGIKNFMGSQQQPSAPAPAATQNTSSILEALANIARQNTSATSVLAQSPAPGNHPQENAYNMSNGQTNAAQHLSTLTQPPPFSHTPVTIPTSTSSFMPPGLLPLQNNQNYPGVQPAPIATASAPAPPGVDPALQQKIAILKVLADQGVPQDQWSHIIDALTAANAQGQAITAQTPAQYGGLNSAQNIWGGGPDESRDRNGFLDGMRSPPGHYRRRSRSRSPERPWGTRDSPSRRRDDHSFADFGRDSPAHGRGGRANEYRQRSPRRGRSPSPSRNGGGGNGEKYIDYDLSIGLGNIKVLSRTLFVGGVTSTDRELRSIFDRFGSVQTCIVNRDKRHAFVKMVSRKDAVNAKEGMENRASDTQLRTKWGVGFGPRDCSDYQTGVSIIPISKLTDADRKWMLSAEYGGSGGKPIEGGMVVEEPDIEIGQGVSSKAISRRMQTDKGGSNGPKSGRDHDDDDDVGHYRRHGSRDDDRMDKSGLGGGTSTATSLSMGFPYNIPTLPNGMPMLPPGFVFPAPSQQIQQPPAPGHRI